MRPAFINIVFATAASAASLRYRQAANVVFKVTNFTAFMADPYVDGAQSNLSFHVTDARPGFEAEVDCVVPNTYFNLYAISALYDVCGKRDLDFMYGYGEKGLTIRRGWRANETSYVTGSATQEWHWVEAGDGANVTKYPDGKLYVRKEEWLFPVTRVQAGTPP